MGVSSCTGPNCERGVQVCNAGWGWRCGELLVSSSTFAVIQRIRKSVPPQKHLHWKNTNTQLQYSLYCYSWDWWWQVNAESTVNTRSSHSKCSRSPSSLVSALLQLLPWLELGVYTLGAGNGYSLSAWITWEGSITGNACTTGRLEMMRTLGKNSPVTGWGGLSYVSKCQVVKKMSNVK